ncbi:phage tail protein [Campylobacter coli]|uniref:phage tail protein n=1 Tax=Campylobacter coli TaxID=195 RepID=UPI000707789E|nr:phage tail protein [Campylobacter coli]EAC1763338.1 phage tail protein [Campylobacter coli]EAH4803868.1 phage tail protein [Campylobacter coli]EAH4988347.1 phage tail protein [Campylobacter coli]EAH5291489.1 phage tail protein [Campylobacter coli]EAH6403924.1 phage tail protein [Campylobacter coli]
MAKSEYYTILTKIGIAKFIAARASGNGVNLKSFKLSSKVILPSEEMQSLEEIVYEANINSKSVDENNPNYINLMCYVPSDIGGFEINAIGIYDEVGDLLAVGNLPRTYKPILKEGSAKELMIKIVMELSNAEEVILKLDPSVIMASRDYVDAIKIELELKIETLKEELKALINTKEDKGVAANLDKALKTELTKLINKKENTGTAASLDAQLRDELIALINKKENTGTAASLDAQLRDELIALINKKENIGVAKQLVDALKEQIPSLVLLNNIELLSLIGFGVYLDGDPLIKTHDMRSRVNYTNTTGLTIPVTIYAILLRAIGDVDVFVNNKKITTLAPNSQTPNSQITLILKPNDIYSIYTIAHPTNVSVKARLLNLNRSHV